MLKTLIYFLIIFSVIVVIHEYGHLFWAKRAGILVREFSLGMGPKLYSHQAEDGTTYTIRMLPLGGYVRLALMKRKRFSRGSRSLFYLMTKTRFNKLIPLIDLSQ
ncbi:site-2 protease family protein [Facklamia hominis]|uniref:site-2 protease family protein n=1 Tax=Facklamia hominis TaxID=178214 RepID=UPI0029D41429|nr:site-2 protease family protein [Facklamia hominis]WPJ91589.1 site-2 protease family protein [Facklamia hominis]